ncbi:MAG: cyclopropane-fatty-acyl-phospholipid synthase family protein [Gammaproteobacteria bacterium]|nr:cyclopropane-fatty-acyl-phospholipid synthase family protein [Gammaproteobacteria bacterium]
MNENTKKDMGASTEAIEHHYGTGNDYFQLWLDQTMTYSCAMWDADDPEQTLDAAQLRKIDYHIEQARVRDGQRVLDIGCGWGGVLNRLVTTNNVESATGLTLSESQMDWIEDKNNDPRIEVELKSWEDHRAADGDYDAIISIGAFEHFAKLGLDSDEKVRVYRNFFKKCHGWLRSRGWMSLQTVAYGNSLQKDFDQFIAKEIFPETDTPRLFELAKGADRLFEVVCLRNDRDDYRRTLRAWYSNLKKHRDQAVALKGETESRKFEQYLRLMAYMFEVGGLDLHRVTLRKIDVPR